MGLYRGIIGPPDSGGRMRIYLTDHEREYVEFDPHRVEATQELGAEGAPFPVHELTIADDAVVGGTLDDATFDALFDQPGTRRRGHGWHADIAALVEHHEAATERTSVDSSLYRCCYTIVYD